MKRLLLGIVLSLLSLPAYSDSVMETEEIRFSFGSHRSYYACSYAEGQMKQFVKAMGGEIVKMRCMGGLPYDSYISLRAEINRPVLESDLNKEEIAWADVRLKGNESCRFNKEMIEDLLAVFTVRNMESSTSCWYSEGRYSFEFQALK